MSDLKEGDVLIIKQYSTVSKVKVEDITEASVMYKNLDKGGNTRVTKAEFGGYEILERLGNEGPDWPELPNGFTGEIYYTCF